MKRALVVNDYSLQSSWADARDGRSPNHFLYGVDQLASHGFDVTLVSGDQSRLLSALDRRLARFPIPFGNLDKQVAALRFLGGADVIYSPCQTQIQLLCYLRALGVFDAPIVCLAHHPIVRGRLRALRRQSVKLMLSGMAAFPSLSSKVAEEINTVATMSTASRALAWGPDEQFYPPAEYPGNGILAAGRTGRDFVTFGRAATQAAVNATILCLRSTAGPEFHSFGPNVRIMTPEVFLEYRQTARMFAECRALAVPMVAQDGLCGLSSVLDALGAGKPVIVTRNRFLDIDVEALGIGRWVEPGDVQGWADAMRFFDSHPDLAEEMGRRARGLVERGLHIRGFASEIAAILRRSIAS